MAHYNYTDPARPYNYDSESADINIMIESQDSLSYLQSKFHYYDSESDRLSMIVS